MSGDGDHNKRHEAHDEHEGTHEVSDFHMRLPSPLDEPTEVMMRQIIGAAISVHRALGPGLLEAIYVDALTIELTVAGLACERERPVMIEYRGVPLRPYRIDLVVGGRVIVEVKAVARFEPVHAAQLASYLRATRLRAGLLLNFNVVRLSQGLKRIVV